MSRLALLALAATLAACEPSGGKPADGADDTGPRETLDADGDGFTVAEGDCDDGDADAYPGAEEDCDGLDQDCDGEVDEGLVGTWYPDADGDGHGEAGGAVEGCEPGGGWVATGDDCDDADADVYPGAAETCDGVDEDCDGEVDEGAAGAWYPDADGDGHGDPAAVVYACEAPAGYVAAGDDCDDSSDMVFAGNPETCDELDNDCNGAVDEGVTTTWYVDTDGDGYGSDALTQEACAEPTGYAAAASDCDDYATDVNPGAYEVCNGIDDDCDATVDEPDALDAGDWYDDADGDGYGDPTTGTTACEAPAGAVADASDCDDADATLNPETTWYIDYDGDGHGATTYTLTQCAAPAGYVREATDCDDAATAVNPDATELCNDVDDDCDGLVDDDDDPVTGTSTWYADADGDGYGDAATYGEACDAPAGYGSDGTDCDDASDTVYPGAPESWYDGVDSDCDGDEDPSVCESLPGGTAVAYDDTCAGAYTTSGWSVVTEWTTDTTSYYGVGNSYSQVMAAPAVGNLTDDDGDGLIDDNDVPDIAFTTFASSSYGSAGYLRVVSGDGSGPILNVYSVRSGSGTYYVSGSGGVALGDLEGDGSPEIATITSGGDLLVLNRDGTVKWLYLESYTVYSAPTIADLDGDGSAEVIVGPDVYSASGALVGSCGYGSAIYPSIAADMDLDGVQELVVGAAVCERDGTLVWNSGRTTGYPGVGNFDTDDEPEVVNVDRSNRTVDLLDDDGTVLWSRTLTGSGGGPPAVADFDGDGATEIVTATSTRLSMLDTDGTIVWAITIDDSSSQRTGASAFDFDGDGAAEVVYADENEVYVLDGATGTELWSSTSHQSGTIMEYPLVADVDRDGHAEIVLPSNDYSASGWAGIHVLGEETGAWASARGTWNQHAYTANGVEDDLTVPTAPSPFWLEGWGATRAQRSWSAQPDGAADLGAALLGVCEDCTNGEVDVYVAVENVGAVFAPAGVDVAVYAVDGASETLLETQATAEPIDPGVRLAPLRFTIPVADVGTDGLLVVVDPDGAVVECDTGNNEASWDALTCTP